MIWWWCKGPGHREPTFWYIYSGISRFIYSRVDFSIIYDWFSFNSYRNQSCCFSTNRLLITFYPFVTNAISFSVIKMILCPLYTAIKSHTKRGDLLMRQNIWWITYVVTHTKWCKELSDLTNFALIQGLNSLSGKTSYRQISWRLEATRLDVIMITSLWNLTGISAAEVPIKLQSDWKGLNSNLAASRLHEILRQDVRPLS